MRLFRSARNDRGHIGGCPRMPFSPNSALYEKNYPRNINHMSVVIFFASLVFGKNCYSRTASYIPVNGYPKNNE